MTRPFEILLAIIVAALLATAARLVRAVTTGGAMAGFVVASLIFLGAGWAGLVLLALFVVVGGLLAKLSTPQLSEQADQHAPRGPFQIIATTGVAALAALLMQLPTFNDPMMIRALIAVIIVTLAASFSDTISAEVGARYGGTPRLLFFGRKLEPGMSGGITLFGLAMGGTAAILFCWLATHLKLLPVGTEKTLSLIAYGGNILDSILGATLQSKFQCPVCDSITEQRRHCDTIGKSTTFLPITNAMVNLIVTVVAGITAYLILQ